MASSDGAETSLAGRFEEEEGGGGGRPRCGRGGTMMQPNLRRRSLKPVSCGSREEQRKQQWQQQQWQQQQWQQQQ
ncbi:unnamed protein product [Lampetra planeri]